MFPLCKLQTLKNEGNVGKHPLAVLYMFHIFEKIRQD